MTEREFTGERFIPGQGGLQIAYEHLHRYLFALRWARRKSVLDIASGSGYGAVLLAAEAESVWAMDLDRNVVVRARSEYRGENLHFLCADATRIPLPSRSVDLVVAMEVLEHIERQQDLVREAARVVRAEGTVLISTPNRALYSDARGYTNPYHVHEFYLEEFLEFLKAHFPWVKILHQQVRAGSLIGADGAPTVEGEIFADPVPGDGSALVGPMYFMAVCSMTAPALKPPAGSVYFDPTDGLFGEWSEARDQAQSEINKLNHEIEALGRWNRDLDKTVAEKKGTIRDLRVEMGEEIGRRDEVLAELRSEFDERSRWALRLEDEVRARDERLSHANAELHRVAEHLARIRHALLYRILCRLKLLPK